MIQPIDLQDDRVFAFRVNGKITTEELKPMADKLTERIRQYGKMRVYAEYVGVEGVTPRAVWEDLKFDFAHLTDFDKAALVTDKQWMNLSAGLVNLVPGLEVKLFSFDEQEQARQWILH